MKRRFGQFDIPDRFNIHDQMKFIRLFLFTIAVGMALNLSAAAQSNGSISGQVVDSLGAVLIGANVTVIAADGAEKTATSNNSGSFTVTGLAPGKYTVRVSSPSFSLYENTEVEVKAGQREQLTVAMTVEDVTEQVDVSSSDGVSTDPQNNADATVLKDKDLEALPDDPDELEAALQALAGPSAGPNGGQIFIDGFTGGQMPPKESIREIRINSNPFSAEYDRLGFGRIEILTKPGSDKWRGSVNGTFNDESLNSRNPFALNRAPSQLRSFGGNISGPVQKGKSSFFLDIQNRDNDSNAVVNAVILDSALNPVSFREDYTVPTRRFSFAPRFDYQINDKNTLVARYSYYRGRSENQGIGNFTLPTRAYDSNNFGHEIRLTETMIINPTTINETRFQYEFDKRSQFGDNSIPSINVSEAFVGGGATIGDSFSRGQSWELQNYTTTSFGAAALHAVKFGLRVRGVRVTDRSENGFGGAFTFAGAPGLTPLDQYRGRILGDLDDYPTQFSITTGNPEQSVSRTDYGLFITDDWRVHPTLTLSAGLRYENQTNISDNSNFAPRLAFAWSPGAGGAKASKTVIRGGFGMFYDRFSESLTLNALRFNGSEQLNLIVNANDPDPIRRAAAIALLRQPEFSISGVTNAPTADQILAVLPQSNVIRRVASDIQSPTTYQIAIGVERQLPARTTMSLFYIGAKTTDMLRARNINAPVCPDQVDCMNALRPDPAAGNIYEYESTGGLTQNQLMVNFRTMFSPRVSLFGNYRLGFANGDTDGAGSFPSYSYDLSNEWGRSSFDIRHNFMIGGNISLPWSISLNPFIIANSGRPFNLTLGQDLNGDNLFMERPTYQQVADRCSELNLGFSWCDIAGNDPNAIIPRNYASGPKFFSVNMRVGKNFGFGSSSASSGDPAQGGGRRAGGGAPGAGMPGGMGGGRGPRGGGMGGFGGGSERKPYNLNVSVNFNNLFNNVNYGTPVGNLSSGRFGQYTSTSGGFGGFGGFGGSNSANRRIDLSLRFSW